MAHPSRQIPPEGSDPLGEALHVLRLSGTFYSCVELTTPWGIALPAFPGCMMFHVVTEGRCWLDVPGAEGRWLETGSLALVPTATDTAFTRRRERWPRRSPTFQRSV